LPSNPIIAVFGKVKGIAFKGGSIFLKTPYITIGTYNILLLVDPTLPSSNMIVMVLTSKV
jgi:hypothetical protein